MTNIRAAAYSRHSTGGQNSNPSADQVEACRRLAERLGAKVVGAYSDLGSSEHCRERPGLLDLLSDVDAGRVDMIVCEAVDRLARKGEDIVRICSKLRDRHVRLVTVEEGEVDQIKLAIAGLIGSMLASERRTRIVRGMKAKQPMYVTPACDGTS